MWKNFNAYARRREIVSIVSDYIHVPPAIVFVVMLLVVIFMVLKGIGSSIIALFLFFVYPSYMTFKAMKGGKPDLMLRFGKYWVILGFGLCFCTFTGWLLKRLPLFGLLKCLTGYLAVRDHASMAATVYDNVMQPILSQYESFIDAKLEALQRGVEQTKQELKDTATGSISATKAKEQ